MPGFFSGRRHLLWLVLGTMAMAVAMAALLIYELAQQRAIEVRSAVGADSVTALVYQFEREFLRLRETLESQVHAPAPPDIDAIALRYDIFYSRLTLVRESPTVADLMERPDFSNTVSRVAGVASQLDRLLASPHPQRHDLELMLQRLAVLGPDVQSMSQAADSLVARTVEVQKSTMRTQNNQIVRLTIAQLVLLLLVAFGLYVRHRRQVQERIALEQLTQDLREARLHADAANRGKSQFLTTMSHELRTPFNGLLGMLQLLQETPVNAQQADYLSTAQTSARRLLALLNDVLDVSALDAGSLALQPAALNLPEFLRNTEALLTPQAVEKRLDWSWQNQLDGPQWVLADPERLRQIFLNIVHNAIKFTQTGSVSVVVSGRVTASAATQLTLVVRDTGIGMDAASLAKLFQRFYQVDASATRRFGGTGLGLEISQALAQMMGGGISVESEPGVGACFTTVVVLPHAVEPVIVHPTQAASQQRLAEPMRVLVAEDHPINQKLIAALLQRMGCQTVFVENGQQALASVQQSSFDLVLMDVNMPVMDGLTAIRHIRALSGPVSQIPIAVVTADVMNEAADKATAAGANAFISKPLQFDQLSALLNKYRNSN